LFLSHALAFENLGSEKDFKLSGMVEKLFYSSGSKVLTLPEKSVGYNFTKIF